MAVAHKSAISVGLLYIPVGLYKTSRDIGVSFNQLSKNSHERIRYEKRCPSCEHPLKNDEIVKGYQYEPDKYVIITDEELENIKDKKDKTIHILHFSKMADIEQIYYEKNYYCIPETGGEKAFELLRQAMLSQKEVAIAKTVLGTHQSLIVLYPTKEGIIAKTLYYSEEIQEIPKSIPKVQLDKQELEMAKTLITTMTQKFDISLYHDEYQERLRQAIEKKIAGQEIVSTDTSKPSNVISIMDALQKTLEMSQGDKGTA